MAQAAISSPAVSTSSGDGVRDTIDSIIVAFILAFVFRAFIVEAFIIPTGSMGPTLYGLHAQIRCENCAYPFVFNIPPQQEVSRSDLPVTCPNCGERDRNRVQASLSRPYQADSGDRILVLKWPYDLAGGLLGPKRWDVVVFRTPIKGDASGPDGKTNYIKRLIGLPGKTGEILNIIDGDVYSAPADKVPLAIREKLDPNHLQPLSAEDFSVLDGLLKIQRKTRVAQSSLWMLHYDHDYPPHTFDVTTPMWEADRGAASNWSVVDSILRFDGHDGSDQYLTLSGKPIRDFYGYNASNYPVQMLVPVSDVRIEGIMKLTQAGAGHLTLSLSKDDTVFLARISAAGRVELLVRRKDKPGFDQTIRTVQMHPLKTDRPVAIAMENVDYRVAIDVDGQRVIETTDSEYSPSIPELRIREGQSDLGQDRAIVRVGAAALPLELSHVRIMRDVYYRHDTPPGASPGERAWGTGRSPIYLRPGEFFVCGDNSPQSLDSRLWRAENLNALLAAKNRDGQYQVGTVPEDQMVGQAFFVYWPAGRRVIEQNGPPIVPDVGHMRMIR